MNTNTIRQYINLVKESENEDFYSWLPEDNETDKIDFDPNASFEQDLELLQQHDANRLGIGKYRQGWHHPFDDSLVVKIAIPRKDDGDASTQDDADVRNLWEYLVYSKCLAEGLPELKLLMPAVDVHPEGKWLTQKKGERVPTTFNIEPMRSKTAWIGDRSVGNYAMDGDKVLSIDYATTKAMEHLDLPMEYEPVRRMVLELLKAQGKNWKDPNYGKGSGQAR
jgi:hypothetical protein